MPNRILRDGILTSERVNALNWEQEVFYRRLFSVVDDYGRFDGRPVILRSALYPLKLDQMREANIERCLQILESAGLVRPYAVDGKPYLEVVNFNQRIQSKSKWPAPPWDGASPSSTVDHGARPKPSATPRKTRPLPASDGDGIEDAVAVVSGSRNQAPRPHPAGDQEVADFLLGETKAGRLNLPPAEADRAGRIWYHECQGRNWTDSKGLPVSDWHGAVRAWALRYAANLGPAAGSCGRNRGNANGSASTDYKLS